MDVSKLPVLSMPFIVISMAGPATIVEYLHHDETRKIMFWSVMHEVSQAYTGVLICIYLRSSCEY